MTKLGLLGLCVVLASDAATPTWRAQPNPLSTPWTADVSPKNAHPEYPRPQFVRKEWLNLNGLWEFAMTGIEGNQPVRFTDRILVPFPVESSLSGIRKPVKEKDRLWYRRKLLLPRSWAGRRILLHFGAVDFEAIVWVNGKKMGLHRGGYDSFTFDITDALVSDGTNELLVSAWDPTDAGTQPRGKQVRNPHSIWYTATSGIWQTVWLEPVNTVFLKELKIIPDIDKSSVTIRPTLGPALGQYEIEVTVHDGWRRIYRGSIAPGGQMILPIKKPHLWSPEDPHLYSVTTRIKLGATTLDRVESYFGMRRISIGKDERGFTRLLLNNRPYFQFGTLDQGFWPDGLYTAPSDKALRYDIELTKKLGFNLARKHVKIEPERWYYWCDKLGLLVWQDMPSGDQYIGKDKPDIQRSPDSARQFETELEALVKGRGNHPSIVMWVPYNEGWGQWDTARIAGKIRQLDSSRLVDDASGWVDRGAGDVSDIHKYPGPEAPAPEVDRASVLGEFGGLGLPLANHTWQAEKNWGYRSFTNSAALTHTYLDLLTRLSPLIHENGLSAAIYTQTTDVEIEVNGLMTYDRKVIKMDAKKISAAAWALQQQNQH